MKNNSNKGRCSRCSFSGVHLGETHLYCDYHMDFCKSVAHKCDAPIEGFQVENDGKRRLTKHDLK